MPLFEDNLSPYLTAVEQASTPATPSAGAQKLFIRTSDHTLCYVNSSGAVTQVGVGTGMTNPLTTTGDMIYSSSGTTPARLAIGTSAQALVGGTTPAWSSAVGILQSAVAKRTAGDLTTTSTSFVDATSLTVTLTTGARRCLVFFNGSAGNDTYSNNTAFDVALDGTLQGGTYGLLLVGQSSLSGGANINVPVAITYLTPVLSAASHTIKIQWRVDGGTGKLFASSGVTPAILTVIETGLTT
jgi:hypothetical protein